MKIMTGKQVPRAACSGTLHTGHGMRWFCLAHCLAVLHTAVLCHIALLDCFTSQQASGKSVRHILPAAMITDCATSRPQHKLQRTKSNIGRKSATFSTSGLHCPSCLLLGSAQHARHPRVFRSLCSCRVIRSDNAWARTSTQRSFVVIIAPHCGGLRYVRFLDDPTFAVDARALRAQDPRAASTGCYQYRQHPMRP